MGKRKIKRICVSCGTPLGVNVDPRRRTCSEQCRYALRRTAVHSPCEQCGRQMRVYKHQIGKRKFCSISCHNDSMMIVSPRKDCEQCGRSFSLQRFQGTRRNGNMSKQRFCSATCRNLWRRTDTLSIDKNGYPYKSIGGKQVYEHRRVMEKMLGRPLRSDETVHHRNGKRDDFSEANLELWSSRHGKGQRVEDKIAFSLDFLRDYGYTLNQTPMSQAIAGIAGLC